jgi:transposase
VPECCERARGSVSAAENPPGGVVDRRTHGRLAALVAGERNPQVLAGMAHGKMRAKIPDLTEALTGHFDDHHALLVGQMLARLNRVEQALAALDEHIDKAMVPWARQLKLLQTIPGVGLRPRK